jgi:CRISPR/Cas system-associated protein Cas10 (large subunit of type III CRISPR-Cas system)
MAATFANDFWYETYEDGKLVDSNYDAFYPRAANTSNGSSFNMCVNDKYLLNMAYFRVKNITFGYTLPKVVTQKISMERARFYVSLENFFTFDHLRGLPIDPEEIAGYSYLNSSNYNSGRAGLGTPAFKTAAIGVQVTF